MRYLAGFALVSAFLISGCAPSVPQERWNLTIIEEGEGTGDGTVPSGGVLAIVNETPYSIDLGGGVALPFNTDIGGQVLGATLERSETTFVMTWTFPASENFPDGLTITFTATTVTENEISGDVTFTWTDAEGTQQEETATFTMTKV